MGTDVILAESREAELMMPVLRVDQAVARYEMMKQYVNQALTDGRDYGAIPGTKRPDGSEQKVLLKPGAEKLLTIFGLTKRFELVERTEDWTGRDHGGEPFFYYLYRSQVYRGDVLIAEADGSCNSWETKYRYRNAQKVCPSCGAATILKSKFAPRNDPQAEPGWYCYAKAGGCGAEYPARDPQITEQVTGKVPNPDPADTVNTVMKMAQKRALVAVTLLAVNASDYFTQDLDDMEPVERPAQTAPEPTSGHAAGQPLDVDEQRRILAAAPRQPKALQELWATWPRAVQVQLQADFSAAMEQARAKVAGNGGSPTAPATARSSTTRTRGRAATVEPPAEREPADVLRALQDVQRAGEPATPEQRGLLASKLEEVFAGSPIAQQRRYDLTQGIYGVASTGGLDKAEASALLAWILADEKDSTGDYPLSPTGASEAARVLSYLDKLAVTA